MKALITIPNHKVLRNVFLPNGKNWISTETQSQLIFESGPGTLALNHICMQIDRAQTMVCLASFLVDQNPIVDALMRAADRGIKIYILGAATAKLAAEIEDTDHSHRKSYERLLKEVFKKRFLFRSAEYFHAKFILIDPMHSGSGFLCTCNFTTKAFTQNPEIILPLSPSQQKELFQIFIYHFWEQSQEEQTEGRDFKKIKPLNKFDFPQLKELILTTPSDVNSNLKNSLYTIIDEARQELVLSVFGMDVSHPLTQLLLQKLKKGLKITLFTRPRSSQSEPLKQLLQAGAEIILHPLLHAKFLLVDQKRAWVFTANFQKHGMDSGFEVGAALSAGQVQQLRKIIKGWKQQFNYVMKETVNLRDINSNYWTLGERGLEPKEIKAFTKDRKKFSLKKVDEVMKSYGKEMKRTENGMSKELQLELEFKFPAFREKYKLKKQLKQGIKLVEYEIGKKDKKVKKECLLVAQDARFNDFNSLPERFNNFSVYEDLQKQ